VRQDVSVGKVTIVVHRFFAATVQAVRERACHRVFDGVSVGRDSQPIVQVTQDFLQLFLSLGRRPVQRGLRRSRPTKLHADKAYDVTQLHRWLRQRQITPRIARKGVESSATLGAGWGIKLSIAGLFGYRLPTIRYERHARLFCAFLTLAAVLTCYEKLAKTK
jgi:hypothetical protein